jgi:hypothetical protein
MTFTWPVLSTELGRFAYSLRGSGDAIDATSKCIAALNTQVAPTNPNPSDVRSLSAAESADMLGKILNAAFG